MIKDILQLIESYNISYDRYHHSSFKCILYGNINRLRWLFENKYPKTLFDKDVCYCDFQMCSHCLYASTHSLLDFASITDHKIIIKFLSQF